VKEDTQRSGFQKQFDFSAPRPRPFLAHLPAHIDTYEEGVAEFFRWRTGLDYYATIDHIVDFVINTKRRKIIDFLTDTGTFALRLAGRKTFSGKIFSFDTNVTLLERAKQRVQHLGLQQTVEFQQFHEPTLPVSDCFAEGAVSIFDFHRHPPRQFLAEAYRILVPEGHLVLAEMLEPKSLANTWKWNWRRIHLRYIQKKPEEAAAVYVDNEEMIQMMFEAGFRQVIIQGLKARSVPGVGNFSLIAATK